MNPRGLIPTAVLSILAACASPAGKHAKEAGMSSESRALDGTELRRLFLNGYNTYLAPVRASDVNVGHLPHELFRPNGTYSRRTGRFGPDGSYAIEGNLICVTGEGIPKQCRKVIPQDGKAYLLIDVSDNSLVLMKLWQVK